LENALSGIVLRIPITPVVGRTGGVFGIGGRDVRQPIQENRAMELFYGITIGNGNTTTVRAYYAQKTSHLEQSMSVSMTTGGTGSAAMTFTPSTRVNIFDSEPISIRYNAGIR